MKSRIKPLFLVIFFSVIISNHLFSQEVSDSQKLSLFDKPVPADFEASAQQDTVYKKNYLVAITSLIVPNVVIGSWNRFVIKSPWAQVSFDYACHFYEHKWAWDDDWYWTNFVLHPYQGSLSYMGARTANFNPYEAFIFATINSVTWEYFFETNAPSINDLIYTSIGAIPVGEMLYRLSYSLQKIWSPLRFVADPVRLYADPMMRYKTYEPEGDVTEFVLRFGAGIQYGRTMALQKPGFTSEFYPAHLGAELYVLYGNAYGHNSNVPYDQFEMTFGFKLGPGNGTGYKDAEKLLNYDVHLLSNGMLLSRAVDFGENKDTTVGLIFDYDFIWQSFYDLSSLSPGIAIKQKIQKENSVLEWQAHLDVLLLGTTDFYYYRRNILPDSLDYRSYSYTIGGEAVGGFRWIHKSGQCISADVHAYGMYILPSQLLGKASTGFELMSVCHINYEIPVVKKLSIGFGDSIYCKTAFYKDLSDIFAFMNEAEVYAKISLR